METDLRMVAGKGSLAPELIWVRRMAARMTITARAARITRRRLFGDQYLRFDGRGGLG